MVWNSEMEFFLFAGYQLIILLNDSIFFASMFNNENRKDNTIIEFSIKKFIFHSIDII